MQVHLDCDRIFQDPNALEKFQDDSLKYNCQKCRQLQRLLFIQETIEKLSQEDKMYFFQEPVEDTVQNYLKIIKTPMCFKYVREKAKEYLINPELLKSDINLIFQNAITFNQPRHQVHKEALKMKDFCNTMLSKIWSKIEKNKLKTLDEQSNQEIISEQVAAEKLGKVYKAKPEDQVYMLPPQELLDPAEHILNIQLSTNKQANLNQLSLSHKKEDTMMYESENDNYTSRGVKIGGEGDMEIDDPNATPGGNNDPHNLLSLRDPNQIGGKNLRIRKHVNYNEEAALGALNKNDQNLAGTKRQFTQVFTEQDPPFQAGVNSIKNLKNKRQNQLKLDPDFIPPTQQQIKPQTSAASLLTQALNQDSGLQISEQVNEKTETKIETNPVNHIQQQQQMMMSYYQEIDDEKCYYSNPARCSFDDPALLFEEMCYLCGSFGNREDFLSCTLCGESFHTYCLQLPEDKVGKYQSYWKCLNCKFCEICASATQEAFLLYCDVCDKAFHSFCLKPSLKSIPNCQWKCQECFKCQQCGTKEFFSLKDTEEKKNLEVTDFEFSQNFSFCYQCGKNEYKKSFCKICQKKTEDPDLELKQEHSKKKNQHSFALPQKPNKMKKKSIQDLMMKCNECGFYSHFRCSRLLPPALGDNKDLDIETNPELLKEYKCLECLLAGKTINHLIRENCEQYENIHQIISRQKLLANLCQDILSKHFPIQEKAPLFIKSFINQNYDFFRQDEQINDWLALLESNVCLETADMVTQDDNQQDDITQEELKNENEEDKNFDEKPDQNTKQLKEDINDNKTDKIDVEMIEDTTKQQQLIQDKSIEIKQFKDINLDEALTQFDKNKVQQKPQTQSYQVHQEMYGYKQTFLPEKRNLYKSLNQGDFHRFGQRELFMDPTELSSLITIPNEENLQKINFAELYVQIEFKAVIRIKFHFFKWFEEMIRQIVKNNSKFMRTNQKKNEMTQNKVNEEQSEDQQFNAFNYDQEQLLIVQQKNHSSEDEVCTEEDYLVINPQMKLQCVLCKLFGEYTVTGRLIPFQVTQFVHVNCAVWSTDVYEIGDGQLVNFFFVQNGKARNTKCIVCNEPGATIICFTRKCNSAFHFPCAYRENKVSFLRTKETYCDYCTRPRDFKLGYLQEFTTKRRFQICRNQIPWNMSIMYQPPAGQQQQNPFALNTQLMALQQTQLSLNNITNPTDLEKPLQIEKWRPFYYDMFNRVGNLTVLSLKKEINLIIEEMIYGAKKEIILDNLSDFAAIRVYWKFYKDYQLNDQEDENIDPINLRKSYFLYSNNSIREVIQNDLNSLLNYASEKIREKIQIGIHFNQNKNIEIKSDEEAMVPINQTVFWQKIMQHFQRERPNFTLQNIIFSISEFGGKTKYPISVWNRAEVKNKGFFLKSGVQVLQLQNQNQDREAQNAQMTTKKSEGRTLDDVFKRMIKVNQMGENQMSSMKRLTSSKHMKYENMLNTLGKKMFYSKSHQDEINDNKNQQKNVLAKKIRLTDTIDTNKEIDLPIAMKYRLSKAQPKRVEVGPSKIHRNGLFTLEDLMPGDIVIEYVGEKIRNKVADKRELYYEQKGIGDCYLFRLDKEYIIDATFFGNKARYLNHSCDANCSAKIINVQQQKHIIISTNRQIKSGEELTYNYNFDYEADKIECFCGAPTCSGRLN